VGGPDVDAIDRDPDGVGPASARLADGRHCIDELTGAPPPLALLDDRPVARRSTGIPAS
jgi:hypothetical protein